MTIETELATGELDAEKVDDINLPNIYRDLAERFSEYFQADFSSSDCSSGEYALENDEDSPYRLMIDLPAYLEGNPEADKVGVLLSVLDCSDSLEVHLEKANYLKSLKDYIMERMPDCVTTWHDPDDELSIGFAIKMYEDDSTKKVEAIRGRLTEILESFTFKNYKK